MNADILDELNSKLAVIYPSSLTKNRKIYANSITKYLEAWLDFKVTSIENEIKIVGDYFGSAIQIKIEFVESKKHFLHGHFSITNENGLSEIDKILTHRNADNLFIKVAKLINSHVKSRPFTIIQYSRGQYKLLDPNGMDYIGQYVTLRDAKNSSCNNYIR